MHETALTITTGQIEGWGLVGCAIIVVAGVIGVRLMRSMLGRVVWTLVALALLGGLWLQRTQIEHSIRDCNPNVLGIHLQISNRHTLDQCRQVLSGT